MAPRREVQHQTSKPSFVHGDRFFTRRAAARMLVAGAPIFGLGACNVITGMDGLVFDLDEAGGGGFGGFGPSTSTKASTSISTSVGTTVTSSSSGGGTCDDIGKCDDGTSVDMDPTNDCFGCAQVGPCQALTEQCFTNNPECAAFNDCLGMCSAGDAACQNNCQMTHQTGINDFIALLECVACVACASSCAVEASNFCGG